NYSNMMDDFCAPQWVDLTRSPQIPSDSYFEVEHEVHKPQMHLNIMTDLPELCKDESKNTDSVTDVKFDDSLEPKTPTCTNIAYFVLHDNKKHLVQKTEKENQLNKAMNDLKLDEKYNKIHQTWNISVTDLTSAFKVSTTEQKGKITIPEKAKKNIHMSGTKNAIVGKQSNTHRLKQCLLGKSQPKVLTCQYRRKSFIKDRKSNQFVSLSEMISKFQNETPERFRTISNKDMKSGPLIKFKRSPLKLTYPISPALRCKQRIRQSTILSQQEREKLELEKMKKHQVKANPVPVNILKGPSVLKKVAKKPATITEEFRLTQSKKICHTTGSQNSQPNLNGIKDKRVIPIIRSMSASNVIRKEHASTESVVENIKSMSCSFEARSKEFQIKKEKKLKNLHIQETNKVKIEFRARPASKFSKPTNTIKEQNTQKRVVVLCPFSFEERNKFLANKMEERVKQMREMNKESRVFHANPVPSFKNIVVHSLSKENLKKNGNDTKELGNKQINMPSNQKNKQLNIKNNTEIILVDKKKVKTKHHTVDSKSDKKQTKTNVNSVNTNYEKLNTQKKVANFELNTKKQAKERNEYNDKIRKDEHELEVKRLEEEKKRLLQQKLERTELRKMTIFKARPMPVYKPLVVMKSTKPPTSPRSPALGLRTKAKSIS
ncbi:Targeting protein for Xklp2-B, partial [Eufriesea mexicana]